MTKQRLGSVDEDLNLRQCYQQKLHAQGSGPPTIRPVSPDERLAHVEPPLKTWRKPKFWA
jgi:hypothetical protein